MGSADAQFAFGQKFYGGEGVKKDREAARFYFTLSALGGSAAARAELDGMSFFPVFRN